MKKAKRCLTAVVSGVLAATAVLSGCGQSKKEVSINDDHLTVYLWENRLMKNIAPYIHEQFPDQDIEFIIGNNDTDLYSYFKEHDELPDIITVRRFSGTDAQDLQPYLMDFASYDVVSKYYSYAVQYYKNEEDEIQWLPICGIPQTIIANKTLFDQYGVKIPENYEEYVQACQQFYDNGIKPYSMDLGEDWSNNEIIQAAAIGEFTSLDGIEWRNGAETAADEVKFDDTLWKRIFSETSQFLKDSHFGKEDINIDINTGTQMFITSSVVFNAVKEVKPATPIGVILASVPPATITSASPCWMERNASPMEWVPVAHAVTTLMHFPLRPNWIETFPAAMLLIIKGTNNGSTLPGPFSNSLFSLRSNACKEPIPDPTLTPTRKGSSFSMSMPDVSRASFAAATANWQKGSIRRAVFGSIYCFGSKSFTSAASLHLKSAVSK